MCRANQKPPSAQAILEAYAIAEDRQHHETPRLPFPSMMAPMYREMAAKLGLPNAEDDVQGFRLSIPRWPAFPDAVAALKRLRKHFRLVAMTNSDNWALSHFAKTLEQPFDDLVTAEDVGWNKPDPQVFAYARGRQSVQGFKFNDFLHVAQSQYHDIAVAKRLGYHVCWIERRKNKQGFGATPCGGKRRHPRLPLRNPRRTRRCGGGRRSEPASVAEPQICNGPYAG